MKAIADLPIEALYRYCDPKNLGFNTTDELSDLDKVIGQPRALRALELGSEVSSPGYNIFVLGIPASGRTTLTQEYLERKAIHETVPPDICYVTNFNNPLVPNALQIPAGQGTKLRDGLREIIDFCVQEIPKVFESEEYIHDRDNIINQTKIIQEKEFNRLQEQVKKYNFLIVRTPYGFVLTPAINGEPIKPEDLEKLSPEQKTNLEKLQNQLSEQVQNAISKLSEMDRDNAEKIADLNSRTITYLINPLFDTLQKKFPELIEVQEYLESVRKDILNNLTHFQPDQKSDLNKLLSQTSFGGSDWLRRYNVNLLVDNSSLKGAPVVVESHPSYQNLIGRIEHEFVMGATRTDFTMIRAGALHKANGGYLIIPARDVLINPYAWEGLKRVLRDRYIRIIEVGTQLGVLSTVTLEPEPIPLNTKIILVGTHLLYYLLRANDEDFAKLFKVRAEFATDMERSPETESEYSFFVKSVLEENQLPPFDSTAVARVIEYSSRLAEHQEKLSTRFGKIADLVCEAAYWARKNQQKMVTHKYVQEAIDEAIFRNNLLDQKIQDMISEGTLMIDVSGTSIGQINALSVLTMGDYSFGKPSRVTAVAAPGKGEVVDIERQAKLGGPIHTKSVLILSGLLANRYGRNTPLNLSASLTFEQSYDEIEGDSASAAELISLLSAIAGIPLRQDRAITGSINQHGAIQAIGGVNEKIEGFYSICAAKGLTGDQGVVIPYINRKNLMLKNEVIAAIKKGQFHIWPIHTIDQAIPLFSGKDAGEQMDDGTYPEGTFNFMIQEQLKTFSQIMEKPEESNQQSK